MNIRDILVDQAINIPDNKVGVLLSGGMDSASVLFSLIEANKDITAYSFTLRDRESTDFKLARDVCLKFDIPFKPIFISDDVLYAYSKLKYLVEIGARKKTDFECFYPMLFVYPEIEENVLATGLGADGHFCDNKKANIHFKGRLDEFRAIEFKPGFCQMILHDYMCRVYNKTMWNPYLSQEMKDIFYGTTKEEINTPNKKQPILDTFPDNFGKIKPFRQSYQKGDAGISDLFEQLLDIPEINVGKNKSVTGIYNRIIKCAT